MAKGANHLFPDMDDAPDPNGNGARNGKRKKKAERAGPPNLGKAIRLPVPDFSDPNRPPTCLEVDFPIAPINALSQLEGNAGKPIYQMSKWWARRRSSIFRAMLIAAATKAPKDPSQAAKLVWDHYYCNHQKAGSFKKLRVLDPFMGGGTTLVEGSRLGFQLTGVDLNPVAWFVTKNELACSDPEQVQALFDHIEEEVKPQVQPFYTTTCPRGHEGRWIDVETGETANVDPIDLPPEQRKRYRWEGPEVIYTFWVKHGPCQAMGCGHRTPIFRTPLIAQKKLSTYYIPLSCPSCGHKFSAELGETRMAPGAERVVLEDEPSFAEMSQSFAQMLKDYNKGGAEDKFGRVDQLRAQVQDEAGLLCPECGVFAGGIVKAALERHARASRVSAIKKKDFGIKRHPVHMWLLIHPDWLKGASGFDGDHELGGYAGAPPEDTATWFGTRLDGLRFVEVRGPKLPDVVEVPGGTQVDTGVGTVPAKSTFRCANCGQSWDIADAERRAGHNSPVAVYALQGYCPQCASEGYNYGGRYFKLLDQYDLRRLMLAVDEWSHRSQGDLAPCWPKSELPYAWETHVQKGNLTRRGYTHWWTMFNPRQLLVHSSILRAICAAYERSWSLDLCEQALGVFQQYLRNQNMFAFWNLTADKLEPMFSNPNYHVKAQVVENCVWARYGRGNWRGCCQGCIDGMRWLSTPYEGYLDDSGASHRPGLDDPVVFGSDRTICGSSTDLSLLGEDRFDFAITDPPFGGNLFYADLADFFYVWLRIALLLWYDDPLERSYFSQPFTPKTMQAIRDPAQHPDHREGWERSRFVTEGHIQVIRDLSGDASIQEKDPNPLYRPEPASDFYRETLTACWRETLERLHDGGILAFTFHHNEDEAWLDVLEALFEAGFILIATCPVRSDETKGESANAAFGSKLIEYDIIHVCRKRLEEPQAVSWARMRRWVREEAVRLKELLEHSHGKELPESDLRVILRGKSLEFYSRHYGQVYTGANEILGVRDALLGINQILDDLLEEAAGGAKSRPPEEAEPASRLFLRIFQGKTDMPRDELHKTLRGTGISQGELESHGWIRAVGTTINVVPVVERFEYFRTPGRTRRVLKTDLDQTQFLIGSAMPGSGVNIDAELDGGTWRVKKAVDSILDWHGRVDRDKDVREAAVRALQILQHWRAKPTKPKPEQMTLFDMLEEEDE